MELICSDRLPINSVVELLSIAAINPNQEYRNEAWGNLQREKESDLEHFIKILFEIIIKGDQNIKIISCAYLRNILIQRSRLPELNLLFYTTISQLYGKISPIQTILQCLTIYITKRSAKSYRQAFFIQTIQRIINNHNEIVSMYMLRAVLLAIPKHSGFCEGQSIIEQIIKSGLIKNESSIWAENIILLSRYCNIPHKWQIIKEIMIANSDKKSTILLVMKYISDFPYIVENAQNGVYVFCLVKNMVGNIPLSKFEEDQIEIILRLWQVILNCLIDFYTQTGTYSILYNNKNMFFQVMDLILGIISVFQQTPNVYQQIARTVEAYCNLVSEEILLLWSQNIRKINDQNMQGFFMLLSGMSGGVLIMLEIQKIVEIILKRQCKITLGCLHVIRRYTHTVPMISQEHKQAIPIFLEYVANNSPKFKEKCFAFYLISQLISKITSYHSSFIIAQCFDIGVNLYIQSQEQCEQQYIVEGMQMLISVKYGNELIHKKVLQCVAQSLVDRTVYRGSVAIQAKFKQRSIHKITTMLRLLQDTINYVDCFGNTCFLIMKACLDSKSQTIIQQSLGLASKILMRLNNMQISQEQKEKILQSVLTDQLLYYILQSYKQFQDHSPQFLVNSINLLIQISLNCTYHGYIVKLCQQIKLSQFQILIEILSIINPNLVNSFLIKRINNKQTQIRVQKRVNIEDLIKQLNIEGNKQSSMRVFPYPNIPKESSAYNILQNDKLISQYKKTQF